MYIPFGEFPPLSLTETEVLFDKVSSTERFLQLIRSPKHRILDSCRDTNSYGEFRFITIADNKKAVTFYGLGHHEYRDRYFINEWHIAGDEPLAQWKKHHTMSRILDKTKVTNTIKREIVKYGGFSKKTRRSQTGRCFETFASLSDDDSMISSGRFS